ncbi:MAG: diacylglycerol kinase family protein [Candidatus Aminicenantes bacterium]|nr:diacylglycerol kinase family protein [Candidatus Aminicenantes bacterium]
MTHTEPLAILFNPSAGLGNALARKDSLEEVLRLSGLVYELTVTKSEAHLRELTRQLATAGRAVAGAGGDSTFHIMANEIVGSGSEAPLGMIGTGSSNDIPLAFGLETMEKACAALKAGRTKRVDLGVVRAEGRRLCYFLGQANVGLGVSVNRFVKDLATRRPGLGKRQLVAGLLGIRRAYRTREIPLRLRVKVDGREAAGEFTLAVFSNTPTWATGRLINPDADPADGVLDSCLIGQMSLLRLARVAALARRGAHGKKKGVCFLRSAAFEIEADEPFLIQADGEILGPPGSPEGFRRVRIEAVPRALPVFA